MDNALRDLRSALRSLRTKPGHAAMAVATLALGMSATIVCFGLVDTIVWKTLPVSSPESLVAVSAIDRKGQSAALTQELASELARDERLFERVTAYLGGGMVTVESGGTLVRTSVAAVSADYFALLGLKPFLGSWFSGGRGVAGSDEVVLGYEFWQRQFAGNPAVIGSIIRVEGLPFRIIGVTPQQFHGLEVGVPTDITIPIVAVGPVLGLPPDWPVPVTHVIGRLHSSATVDGARAELLARWPRLLSAGISPGLPARLREQFFSLRAVVSGAAHGFSRIRQSYSRALYVVTGFSGLMLFITCANVAGLLLARTETREHEFAVRLALGASRRAILQQLLLEAVIISAAGAALAAPLAWWAYRFAAGMIMPLASSTAQLVWEARTVLFIFAVVLAIALAVGSLPAWILSRRNPQAALQKSTRTGSSTSWRWSRGVLVVQVAAAVVMLGANLSFVRTLVSLRTNDTGFRIDGVVIASLAPQPGAYDELTDSVYYPELVDRLSRLPGVRAVALSKSPPVTGRDAPLTQAVAEVQAGTDHDLQASLEVVSPDFFRTLGIPILIGREFEWSDNLDSAPVAIVSAQLARRLFGDVNCVGQYVRYGAEPRHQKLRIVGVSQDASLGAVRHRQPLVVFVAWLQQPPPYARWPTVEISLHGDPVVIGGVLRHAVSSLKREYVESLRTLDQQLDTALTRERLLALVATAFGLLGSVLVAVGLTAVLTYSLERQRRDIGVRLALGASGWSVRRLIVTRTIAITVPGIAVGMPLGIAAMVAVRQLLPTAGLDFAALAVAAGSLLVLSLGVSLAPARGAARVSPLAALRAQ